MNIVQGLCLNICLKCVTVCKLRSEIFYKRERERREREREGRERERERNFGWLVGWLFWGLTAL